MEKVFLCVIYSLCAKLECFTK